MPGDEPRDHSRVEGVSIRTEQAQLNAFGRGVAEALQHGEVTVPAADEEKPFHLPRPQSFRQALEVPGPVQVPQSGKLDRAPAERGDAPAGLPQSFPTSPGNAPKKFPTPAPKADHPPTPALPPPHHHHPPPPPRAWRLTPRLRRHSRKKGSLVSGVHHNSTGPIRASAAARRQCSTRRRCSAAAPAFPRAGISRVLALPGWGARASTMTGQTVSAALAVIKARKARRGGA